MKKSSLLKAVFFAVGLCLLALSVHAVGVGNLRLAFSVLDKRSFFYVLIYIFVCSWDVAGWHVLLLKGVSPGFFRLFFVRLSGEAMNNLTPFFDFGGEPLKASLLFRCYGVPSHLALASVILERTLLGLAEIVFWVMGLALFLRHVSVPAEWRVASCVTVLVSCVVVIAVFWLQKKGLFAFGMRVFGSLGGEQMLRRFRVHGEGADSEIAAFYSTERPRLAAAFVLHFLGWTAGAVETWAIFALLGKPVGFPEAIGIEAFYQLLRSASFFIPGNIGAQEGGLALLGQWIGVGSPAGLALSLLKRFRQLSWNTLGLLAWAWQERKRATSIKSSSKSISFQ